MEDYGNNKETSYLKYWDINNLYSREMSQKLPVNDFKWVKDVSEFDESNEGYFFEVDIQYLENLHNP